MKKEKETEEAIKKINDILNESNLQIIGVATIIGNQVSTHAEVIKKPSKIIKPK